MNNHYWAARISEPDHLFRSLAVLLASPPSGENSYQPPIAEQHPIPDLSTIEVDESGLDFLTEYRAGLPDVTPEPNPEPIETVPDPVPGDFILDTTPDPEPAPDVEPILDPEAENTEDDLATHNQEPENETKNDPEPTVIYVRDYGPDTPPSTTTQPSTLGAPVPQAPQPPYPGGGTEGWQAPEPIITPLAPIAMPGITSTETPVTPTPHPSQGVQPLVLPPQRDATNITHVEATNASVYAQDAHIAGLENFDPTRYLDFDDHPTNDTGGEEGSESSEDAERARTRRVLGDFGAGKRITQTENPAQAMQVLRELTVFRT